MNHSLNEIEAMCKRAARGAGLSWGLAEEAAKGTRWLSSFDLAGVEMLAALLAQDDKVALIDVSPVALRATQWHAPIGRMNPLVAGASLSDCAVRLSDRGSITIENLSFPLLAVPFMAGAALRLGVPVAVQWPDAQLATDGRHLCVQATAKAMESPFETQVVFSTPAQMSTERAPVQRAIVSTNSWNALTKFAHRTYAPATDESRLLGAGAGPADND
jgi:hypothetical protein